MTPDRASRAFQGEMLMTFWLSIWGTEIQFLKTLNVFFDGWSAGSAERRVLPR
jgi:hypothetical protein